jgi:hypothetical protein
MHLASDLGSKSMSIRASLLFLLLPSSMIVLTVMAPQARYRRAQESIYHRPAVGTLETVCRRRFPTRGWPFLSISLETLLYFIWKSSGVFAFTVMNIRNMVRVQV